MQPQNVEDISVKMSKILGPLLQLKHGVDNKNVVWILLPIILFTCTLIL